ncbi:hypothetical protein DV735_g2928, partial [Chaetothyriales sp. CBS 134920]
MAPLAPKSNKSAKAAKSGKPMAQSVASLFPPNKRDKRRIKHAQLLSKITKSQHSKKPRRGRASKKLVATLDALANALPDDGGDGAGIDKEQEHVDTEAQAIIRRKSLKSRPGALKRRQKVDQEEMARFSRNMAQLAASAGPVADAKTAAAPTQKWAALRSFISQTLEKKVPAT